MLRAVSHDSGRSQQSVFHRRAFIIAILVTGAAACSPDRGDVRITGQIEGHPIAVGSRIGGRIVELAVHEGDAVSKGDVIFRIDPAEAEAELAATRAVLAQTEAQLDKLEAGPRIEEILAAEAVVASAKAQYDEAVAGARSQEIGAARAVAESARADVNDAQSEFKRQSELYEANVGPFAAMDQARHRLESARGALESAEEQLELLLAGTRNERISMAKAQYDAALAKLEELQRGTRTEDLAAAQAARDQAAAQVKRAEVNLAEMTVLSPVDGVVETLDLRPGDIVPAGAAARIIDPNDLDLTVYVSAALLGHLRIGARVPFTTDSFGDEEFEGAISFISTVGEFTPRNLQTEEDRVQQVFEVKIHTDSAGGRLRPGMAGTVTFSRE